jgi:sulfopyruvate decarboxylase TPP-binding subunit
MPYRTAPLVETLRSAGIDWVLTVPLSGMDGLYQEFAGRGRCIFATREEEAVATAAGLVLGGSRPIVVMQQSGVGNALNAVFTLADAYEIAFPILVFDRGESDPNPIQKASSRSTLPLLQQLGATTLADWSGPGALAVLSRALATPAGRWLISPLNSD